MSAQIIALSPQRKSAPASKAPRPAKRPDQTPLHDFIDIRMGLSDEGFEAWIALGYRMANGGARA